eukprot:CAMPEP_0185449938 /NCGR_PEP_ID=MMETSP1365-20130426/61857_1 /TAXON_ID=38817 /ORGANISM="Gephyrocapsa oceanica, Strain RCC1303" /LENGTH=87 /DNA_ID=CAMNT_0028055999 /DNA_START=3 /DNA_END=262 /DNA_ORIENTATION=+
MDCNACEFCLDKKKNGGPGLKRKACPYKQRGGGPAAGGSQSAEGAGAQQPAEAAPACAPSPPAGTESGGDQISAAAAPSPAQTPSPA